MIFHKRAAVLLPALLIAACGGAQPDDDTPASESQTMTSDETEAPQAAQSEAIAAVALSELAQKGKQIYLRCQACHTVEQGEPHLVGPNLHGIIGANAGAKEGYTFSPALSGADLVWDEPNLDKWLEAPQQLVPGNKMAFAGLPKEEDRAAVIQYLVEVTQ
ncbi:c-type cytochrome [Erythrobacter sp. W53]|uniref:c-type cytochrome n=1 Tax=Erythrobacter sp. W53 TaxID=3425947 RepID=UPI003D7696EF